MNTCFTQVDGGRGQWGATPIGSDSMHLCRVHLQNTLFNNPTLKTIHFDILFWIIYWNFWWIYWIEEVMNSFIPNQSFVRDHFRFPKVWFQRVEFYDHLLIMFLGKILKMSKPNQLFHLLQQPALNHCFI